MFNITLKLYSFREAFGLSSFNIIIYIFLLPEQYLKFLDINMN